MPDIDFFKNEILPEMVKSQSFGENVEIISVIERSSQLAFQLMSTVLFVDVEVKVLEDLKKFPLVCKFSRTEPEVRERLQLDLQFFNENLVYQRVIPLMPHINNIVPKFYFGQSGHDLAHNNCIIVENLVSTGYKLTTDLYFDYEHCSLVFEKLGQFHGSCLLSKATRRQQLLELVEQLGEQRWLENRKEELNYAYRKYAMRGISPLMDNGESCEILKTFKNRISDIYGVMLEIFRINETSVLCHGDFNGNNMIFKYRDERPVDVKFFDLATAKLASPIIDISFFLFLNTSSDLRRKHFKQDLLKIYLEGMKSVAGPLAPTMEQLWAEFQQKAIYGYFIVAFFLPLMAEPRQVPWNLSLEEKVKLNLTRGGCKVTEVLVDIVRDLIEWACLK